MVDPATATIIASAVGAGASMGSKALGSKAKKKAGKYALKEMKRETLASLLQDALNRDTELEAHKLGTRAKKSRRRTQSLQDTADLVRGAFSI